MSHWTHVTGAIRVDGVPSLERKGKMLEFVKSCLGKTCDFEGTEKEWKECTVPRGSEGSIQYLLHEYSDGLPWLIVSIWGDLRDYDDKEAIFHWFKRACDDLKMVRQGVILVDNEARTYDRE